MKLHRILGLFLAVQLCAVMSAFGQGSYKVEAIGAAPAADVPAPIQSILESAGVRVTDATGATLCEVWLNKTLPTNANPSTSPDIMFGTLPPGAFVGVMHFPKATPDFRGQTMKAGYYALRYALIPQDGNHMGVYPTRDAFHLGPASADETPEKILTFDEMVKLGRLASGTPHPAFLVGAAVNGSTFPSVFKDDTGNWDLQLQGHQGSAALPLAFTVVGQWQQ